MRLSELFHGVGVREPLPGIEIATISLATNEIPPHCLYVKHPKCPGNLASASRAIANGAVAVVIDESDAESSALVSSSVPVFSFARADHAYAVMAANLFGNAHRDLIMIGVTGTKGKTTTAHLVDDALRATGMTSCLVSSQVRRLPSCTHSASSTTPRSLELHGFLGQARKQHATHSVLEVSSIGIEEERVHGIRFAHVAFTNIGSDHLEYHGGRDRYHAAKRRLFTTEYCAESATRAINADDDLGQALLREWPEAVGFGLRRGNVRGSAYACDATGIRLDIGGDRIRSPLLGMLNVYNLLAAYCIARNILGSGRMAAEALSGSQCVPGRLERVSQGSGIEVYVDYAHTTESVEAVLGAIREFHPGRRVVALIGCSGNSDKTKRAPLARAAALLADACVFTSDNPDREHPATILMSMLRGLNGLSTDVVTVVDRAQAIRRAIEMALPGGVVVLMGKGDETHQLINGMHHAHSDREIAGAVLTELGGWQRPLDGGKPT